MTSGGAKAAETRGPQIIVDLRTGSPRIGLSGEPIPFLSLKEQHISLEDEIIARWRELLRSGAFIGGTAVDQFEDELAEFLGVDHTIGVANGTEAITLALVALGVQPGDEVITAANTFFATAEAIVHAGAIPVLADVDPETATIDPDAVRSAITPRTTCIVPVHLYGQAADMDAIMAIADEHGLLVVEDNAQAVGAIYGERRTGSIGHASAMSFYPGKNLGATGDGGAVATSDEDAAARVRILANHGSRTKYDHIAVGYNSRLDAIHAAALSVKLGYLDHWNRLRGDVADRYRAAIDHHDVAHPLIAPGRNHIFHLYVVRSGQRDSLRLRLDRYGISTGLHYPTPIHLTPPFSHLGALGEFPISELWASTGLSLPMFPEMTDAQVEAVAAATLLSLEDPHVLTLNTA